VDEEDISVEIKVGVHQGSCLSPLLFIIVTDAVSEYVRHDVPRDMLYADDLILSDISSTNLQKRLGEWQEALETSKQARTTIVSKATKVTA